MVLIRDLFWISRFCLHCLFGRVADHQCADGQQIKSIIIISGVQVRKLKFCMKRDPKYSFS